MAGETVTTENKTTITIGQYNSSGSASNSSSKIVYGYNIDDLRKFLLKPENPSVGNCRGIFFVSTPLLLRKFVFLQPRFGHFVSDF